MKEQCQTRHRFWMRLDQRLPVLRNTGAEVGLVYALLPVLIEEQGLFDEQRRIKNFAEDISYKLDAIGRGWAVLKPGDCEFCARILV